MKLIKPFLIALLLLIGSAKANQTIADKFEMWERLHEQHLNVLNEQDGKLLFPDELEVEGTAQVNFKLINWLLSDAFAQEETGELCFFGGWPSYREVRSCRPPWKYMGNPDLTEIGPTYDRSLFCGKDNLFRCNPVIFGGGTNGKGKCVTIRNYNNLTKRCSDQTRSDRKAHFEKLKTDPVLRDQYLKTMEEVREFCKNNPTYDACKVLLGNLQESGFAACFGADDVLPESENIEKLATDVKAVMADIPIPKPRPTSDELIDYSNSPEVDRMINTLRGNLTKRCSQSSCSGRRKAGSVGYCWRYVKHGLMGGGYTKNYPSSVHAKNAGPVLKRLGFKNLMENPKYKGMNAKNAPKGAVLVYSGGKSGHIEVKVSSREYLSDFAGRGPISDRLPRKLIGIYIK